MSMETRLGALATRAGQEDKALRALIAAAEGKIGDLATLATTDKASIVAALNEIATTAGNGQTAAQVQSAVDALETKLLGGASIDFDTLKEIADFANNNEGLIVALTTRVGAVEAGLASVQTDVANVTARVTAVEGVAAGNTTAISDLSTAVGNTERDLVADYEAALNAV